MRRLQRLLSLGMMGGGGAAVPITYLFRDEFTTPEATPIASPRTCEPGPGSWTVTQTAGTIAIVDGKLEITGNNATGATSLYSVDNIAFTAGRALFFERLGGTAVCRYGFATSNGWPGSSDVTISYENGGICSLSGSTVGALGLYTAYGIILSAGTKKFVGRVGGAWKLLWIDYAAPNSAYHATFQHYSNTKNILDDIGVQDLAAPWNTDYGIVSARSAAPADGEVLAAPANAFIHFKWTPAAAETLELMFRRTDDDNCWILRCDQAAGTIKLYRKEAGTETEVEAGKTQTWTAGTAYRIFVRADDASLKTYVNRTLKHNYASATFNQTASGAKVSGFATGAEFDCFPEDLPPF